MDQPSTAPIQRVDPELWVDEYGDYLYRYALSRLRDADAAEEVLQETFLAGLRHAEQYSGRGHERAWLLGILRRKIIDLVRQRCRTTPLDESTVDEVSQQLFDERGSWRTEVRQVVAQPSDALERKEFWEAFRRCLAALPPRQADIFALREMEGQSTEQICKELEISPSNLWVLLYRARLRLSACMKSRGYQKGAT